MSKLGRDDKEARQVRDNDVNRETGQIIMAIRNLYTRCTNTQKSKKKPFHNNWVNNAKKLDWCLSVIRDRLVDLNDVKEQFKEKLVKETELPPIPGAKVSVGGVGGEKSKGSGVKEEGPRPDYLTYNLKSNHIPHKVANGCPHIITHHIVAHHIVANFVAYHISNQEPDLIPNLEPHSQPNARPDIQPDNPVANRCTHSLAHVFTNVCTYYIPTNILPNLRPSPPVRAYLPDARV